MNATDTLRGLRVLIAEDNFLIGESLRDLLIDLGCVVIGPVPDLAEVMAAIEAGGFDAALLDIHLGDANILPAASELASRGIPFIVTTGGGSPVGLPIPLARAPRLHKPFDARRLEEAMDAAFLPRAGVALAGR
jgi:DNA-binding response OmpR family regulator